jgi:hypothetical protein
VKVDIEVSMAVFASLVNCRALVHDEHLMADST